MRKGEVGEEAGEPWEAAERRVPEVTSWVRREGSEGVSRSNPVALWFCVPCFFSLSCFLAERTVILLVDFLVLLHPSVLQSVLGGWSHGAEL